MGITSTYTADDAQSLLPKIQADMQTQFNVGQNIPYALMVSWLDPNDQQAKMLLVLNWAGFGRISEFSPQQQGLIYQSVQQEFEKSIFNGGSNALTLALRESVAELDRLLTASMQGYFEVDGKFYGPNDTLFTCKCNTTLELKVFRADSLPFPEISKPKVLKPIAKTNRAQVDRIKASGNGGTVVEATFQDKDTVHTARLLVYVMDVDFEHAPQSLYSFDENEIAQYNTYAKNAAGDFVRWKLVPKTFDDRVGVKITPGAVAANVHFTASSGVVTPQIAGAAAQTVTVQAGNLTRDTLKAHIGGLQGCRLDKLILWHPDTITLYLRFIWVSEEDDDVQVIPKGQGKPMSIGILPGNDGFQSTPAGDDGFSVDSTYIHTGLNGILETTIASGDNISPNIRKKGEGQSNQTAITRGANNFLDTNPIRLGGDDALFWDPVSKDTVISTGPNGICETMADSLSSILYQNELEPNLVQEGDVIIRKVGIYIKEELRKTDTLQFDQDYDGVLLRPNPLEFNNLIINYNMKQDVFFDRINPGVNRVTIFFIKGLLQDSPTGIYDGVSPKGSFAVAIPINFSGGSRTLLHEIGHGAFDLGHTHDIKNAVDNKNLMSYPPGPELRAYQWQLIQQKYKQSVDSKKL
ncbi:MAG: hypothetical protein IPI11_18555 [Haliscomenobacter sp.]|nr:hypothetical protein [Haliscomenobacter sp.]